MFKNDQRGKSAIVIPDEVSAADAAALPPMTLVAPFETSGTPRSKDDLKREIKEVKVNSIEDICREFDVRISGTYKDVDGEEVEASIPVSDEDTFTESGMTPADPGLFNLYIRSATYEQCADYLERKNREGLTDEEIANLETTIQYLEASLKECDDE